MSNSKLFVSNLDFELKPEDVRLIFSDSGQVANLTLVTDRESGRSRGYCFVEMGSPEEARKAIEDLNQRVVNGRPISVAEDRGRKATIARGEGSEQRQPLQPMQRVLFFRKKRRGDPFVENPHMQVDYRDVRTLVRFVSERGRILPRRLTGLNAYNQRRVAKAIKRAQNLALLPFSGVQD